MSEPRFQRFQFDKKLNRGTVYGAFDEDIHGGFQIKEIRPKSRGIPEWARTNEGIQKVLLTAFPKLHINPSHRQRAGRWAQVIELFFKRGWSETDVAEALQETVGNIRRLVVSISWVSEGKTVDGKERTR